MTSGYVCAKLCQHTLINLFYKLKDKHFFLSVKYFVNVHLR